MRVISGKARGKKLIAPTNINTRPTLDRVKEAMFNKIQFDLKDATCLDLFAGTGALGIEALSRGASKTAFCDESKDAIRIIKKNIEITNNLDNAIIIHKDYNLALEELKHKDIKFDIVFLDPPYKTNLAILALQKMIMSNLLTKRRNCYYRNRWHKKGRRTFKNKKHSNFRWKKIWKRLAHIYSKGVKNGDFYIIRNIRRYYGKK